SCTSVDRAVCSLTHTPKYRIILKLQRAIEWVILTTFRSIKSTAFCFFGDVPQFVEHCEAVAAEVDVTRRWLDEQERRRLSSSFDVLPERHAVPEVLIPSRSSTGTSGSCACAGLGTTCRG